MADLITKIAGELKLNAAHVNNVVKLLFEEQCTIPFVARYRKEVTGTMDEVALRSVRDRFHYLTDLEDSKKKYLKVVEEHCAKSPELKAKFPGLKAKFEACTTKQELDDLYLPFKPKRRTRAMVAKEKGLEPLLTRILEARATLMDMLELAKECVTPTDANIDVALKVASPELALAGAADILAERISETAEYRALVREISFATGELAATRSGFDLDGEVDPSQPTEKDKETKAKGKKTDASKYENYFNYKEKIANAQSHRIMAVRRGEAEKVLRVSIEVDTPGIIQGLETAVLGTLPVTKTVKDWIKGVVEDTQKRLLGPSIETEIRLQLKGRAEEEAIKVFSTNLANLLLLPPIPNKTVLGVDPGLRTGSKLAVVSDTGKHLFSTTIYPDPGRDDSPKSVQAKVVIAELISKFNISCLAIGNGTGSREIDKLITSVIREKGFKDVKRLVVNEAGASVYSTDDLAREEFPDLDATIRSAISIARRLQDPLAELVKIDPRSIGVGQYQHDVNVTKLKNSLEEVVESCVNKVGVNLNTASYKLLSYVSGIGPGLAKSIVTHRDKNGKFNSRSSVTSVPGFGPKAYEQAAGFLRVPESANPLDNSSVHPERYEIVQEIAAGLKKPISELIGQPAIVNGIAWEKYVTATVGMPTLKDIASELIKPGRDPREDGARLLFSDEVSTLEDLKQNMVLKGTVTNVTNFGAFVDIGVHQDGLVHISELSDNFIKDPAEVVAVGDVLDVRVLDVDKLRKRISLTCKTKSTAAPSQSQNAPQGASANPGAQRGQGGSSGPRPGSDQQRPQQGRQRPQAQPEQSFTMGDLLSKFNRK